MKASTIFFFRGLPASGKSTKRNEMLKDPNFQPITYTNKDEIRHNIVSQLKEPWSKKIEKMVEKRETELVEAACLAGMNLIIDNTHGSLRHQRRYEDIARQHGFTLEVVNFDTPLNVCIERDKDRPNGVGESVIRQMFRQSFVKPYVPDSSLPRAIIVDLDGTLFTATDRSWFEYSKCATDLLVVPVHVLLQSMMKSQSVDHVLFLTGRDETGREAAELLLTAHGYPVDGHRIRLFMKAANDYTPDHITKCATFNTEIQFRYQVLFVLEDRQRVVDMWRELGLTCFQVAEKND